MGARYQNYPCYEDCNNGWFDKLPTPWIAKKLKHLAPIVTERAMEQTNPIGLENIEGWTGKLLPTESEFQGDGIQFTAGDLLFGKLRPYLAKALLADSAGQAVGDFHILRPTDENDSRFLQYQMLTKEFISVVDGSTYGAKMPRASWDFMGNLTCSQPSLSEQRTIAAFLDHETAKIDTLIENQQQLIKLLKEKRQAVISHAVTKGIDPDVPRKDSGVEWLGEVPEHWEVGSLNYYLEAVGDIDHYMPKSIEQGVPYVMTGDLTEFVSDIKFSDCKQVSLRDFRKLSKKIKSSKGDVIMARYATIGTVSYVDIDEDYLVSYSCVTIKPNPSMVMGLYLFYYFQSFAFFQGIQSQVNTNTQDNVGTNDLRKLKVCLPNLQEQSEIVESLRTTVNKLEQLIKNSETAISLLKEKRAALISAAVTGKIDVRNWQPEKQSAQANAS